eukprot:6025128-Prorocentrum_lima.AAC.1
MLEIITHLPRVVLQTDQLDNKSHTTPSDSKPSRGEANKGHDVPRQAINETILQEPVSYTHLTLPTIC